jgi:hypothetical protein
MSSPIRETLASGVLYGKRRTLTIIVAERDAVIVAPIVFRQVAVQMLLFTVLIDALHAALENTEVAFNSIGVNLLAILVANIFFDAVLDSFMRFLRPAESRIEIAFVGM